MKNGEQPINPTFDQVENYLGLTKREYFTGLAMQGIMANRWSMELGNYSEKDIAKLAIEQADELLKQLEK